MWYKQPVKDRLELMKTYKKAYPEFSYHDMVKHFSEGGEMTVDPPTKSKPISNVATRSDSLALYNSANALNAYYDKLEKKGLYTKTVEPFNNVIPSAIRGDNEYNAKNLKFLEQEQLDAARSHYKRDEFYIRYDESKSLTNYKSVGSNAKEYLKNDAKAIGRLKNNFNPNTAIVYDVLGNIIDTGSPAALYDARIKPDYYNHYIVKDKNIVPPGGGISGIYTYDPLKVAPWDILNKEQQKERLQKYGTSGSPMKGQMDFKKELRSITTKIPNSNPNVNQMQMRAPDLSSQQELQPRMQMRYNNQPTNNQVDHDRKQWDFNTPGYKTLNYYKGDKIVNQEYYDYKTGNKIEAK